MSDEQTMGQWNTVDDILDFAIEKEQEAVDFYTNLAERSEHAEMKSVFQDFANEEKGHKSKLERVKTTGELAGAPGKVLDLKIGDYLVDVEPTPDMDYQDALIVAIKREAAAYNLYWDLAAATGDLNVRTLMEGLAKEEARHKLRFETLYDDDILKEN